MYSVKCSALYITRARPAFPNFTRRIFPRRASASSGETLIFSSAAASCTKAVYFTSSPCYPPFMVRLLHESMLWVSLAAIMGTCIYLSPGLGLMVAGAGIYWIARVLNEA